MSSELKPWVTEQLEPTRVQLTEVQDIARIVGQMWMEDYKNFRSILTSTDEDDSFHGQLAIDKHATAIQVWEYATENEPESLTAQLNADQISRRMGWAAKRQGKGRPQIALAKAKYLAVTAQAYTNGDEPGRNTEPGANVDDDGSAED